MLSPFTNCYSAQHTGPTTHICLPLTRTEWGEQTCGSILCSTALLCNFGPHKPSVRTRSKWPKTVFPWAPQCTSLCRFRSRVEEQCIRLVSCGERGIGPHLLPLVRSGDRDQRNSLCLVLICRGKRDYPKACISYKNNEEKLLCPMIKGWLIAYQKNQEKL